MLTIHLNENFMPCSSYMKLCNLLYSIIVRSRNIFKKLQVDFANLVLVGKKFRDYRIRWNPNKQKGKRRR